MHAQEGDNGEPRELLNNCPASGSTLPSFITKRTVRVSCGTCVVPRSSARSGPWDRQADLLTSKAPCRQMSHSASEKACPMNIYTSAHGKLPGTHKELLDSAEKGVAVLDNAGCE